jgi:hypothetical protein
MTNEELNTALYNKMFLEQEYYRCWLVTQSPEDILDHAYRYTIREDILMSLEGRRLSDAQCQALLRSPCPLKDVYKEFNKRENDHMADIWDTMEDRANHVLQREQEKKRDAR